MKIFQSIQNSLKMLGIYRPMVFQQFHRLNRKNVGLLAYLGVFFLAAVLYIVFEAETFNEYSESFFSVAVGLVVLILLILAILKASEIFELIDNYENVIGHREYNGFACIAQYAIENWNNTIQIDRNGKVDLIEEHVRKSKCSSWKMDDSPEFHYSESCALYFTHILHIDNLLDSSNKWLATERLSIAVLFLVSRDF